MNKWRKLWQDFYFLFCFVIPGEKKSGIYCGPSRRWRRVRLALSTFLKTSELLECPSPTLHCQGLLATLASTGWAHKSLQHGPLAAIARRRALHLPFVCPSVLHKARERQGNLLPTSPGPSPFTKKKLNGTYGATSLSFPPSAQCQPTAGWPRLHKGYQTNCKGCSSRMTFSVIPSKTS